MYTMKNLNIHSYHILQPLNSKWLDLNPCLLVAGGGGRSRRRRRHWRRHWLRREKPATAGERAKPGERGKPATVGEADDGGRRWRWRRRAALVAASGAGGRGE
ncbi:hypothetical protein GUJ93_ZPchr0001g31696 [Zizania palustris]|uniref:Uncharacterized protein n=1 Tax=Zizania palustris TaxID=103762 RepID=A0A8J5RR43_ZIZPA|nr:hypothetical protein GUJ93_ZPchr0001g31696 [Zizania palustris]